MADPREWWEEHYQDEGRRTVAQEMQQLSREPLLALVDMITPTDDIGEAFEEYQKLRNKYPELVYRGYYEDVDLSKWDVPPPTFDEFKATWGSLVDWENPFGWFEKPPGTFSIYKIMGDKYEHANTRGGSSEIPDPSGSLTKSANKRANAEFSNGQIRAALRATRGNARAAARLLLQ